MAVAVFTGLSAFARAADPAPAPTHVPPSLFKLADPDLEITVWAKSPLLKNPTNMDTDQYGRIWVAEGVNYRSQSKRQPEGDRIIVTGTIGDHGMAVMATRHGLALDAPLVSDVAPINGLVRAALEGDPRAEASRLRTERGRICGGRV